MVVRLAEIFGHPQPPAKVTQKQFDGFQTELEELSRKPWHEIGRDDYWYYLLDLCYVPLQQDLFDYVFPAFLIRWWEGQLNRMGGPESETDFYRAIEHGECFYSRMSDARREAVYAWMTDAYVEGIDAWSGSLSVTHSSGGPDDLHGPMWSLHALGQSVPIIPAIWDQLCQIRTAGRAQFWLVLIAGIAFPPNACPWVPPWTPTEGGGGVYAIGSCADIGHGYLSTNLEFIKSRATAELLASLLNTAVARFIHPVEREWAIAVTERVRVDPTEFHRRLDRFLEFLGKPHLGSATDDL